jgi:predicted ATPase
VFSFIGRSNDVEVIRALLTRGERVVTVTGAAGIGKSRLVRQIARIARLGGVDAIEAGNVLACDLGDARTEDDVATVVAHATNAAAHGPRVFEALAERLARHGRLLLVLDGVTPGVLANGIVACLLEAAPRLQLLVASREPLSIDGEQVHALGPLAVEDGVALVRERLAGSGASEVDEDEEQSLVRLVELLDGVPLALELGALCIAGLGLSNALQHLARAALLARGTVPLDELLALAWRALDPHERTMLARCSVFRGGFTVDAAIAVAGGDRRAVDVLESLGDKALLCDDENRLRLHPRVREHAATQLAPEDDARSRHAAHYLEAGEAWARDPFVEAAVGDPGSPRPTALARIAAERENLLAVVEHALAGSDGTTAARALLVLSPVALARGPIPPYLALVERALELPMPIDRRIALLATRGKALRHLGRDDEAEQVQHDAVLLARGAGFRREEARLLGKLGMAAYARCDFDTALARLRAALELQSALGDAGEQAITMAQLALVHRELGAIDEAHDAALRALAVLGTTGQARYLATTLAELARCHLDAGDIDRARADLAGAREVCQGDAVVSVFVRWLEAIVEHAAGDLDAAEAGYVEAIHASRGAGHPRLEGGAFVYLGILSFDRGDLDAATERLEHGLALLRQGRDIRYAALASAYLAAIARLTGDEERAGALFLEAKGALREGDPMRTAIDILQLTPGDSALPPYEHAASSWDVRHALERYERAAGSRTTEAFETDAVFQVAADGAWMGHAGRHVECSRRAAAQRLLAALARARAETPGKAIPSEDLVAAGWPNEQIMPSAAKNRLRVALSWLRKNGLGQALQSRADGYLLDPTLVDVAPPSRDRSGEWKRS